jgi:quinol-cytochrome oxidoreductase complex cytochrome b subunit
VYQRPANRRSTATSLAGNVAAGVLLALLSYFGLLDAGAKHQVLWAIVIGVLATVMTFFMYRWRTFPGSSRGSRNGDGQGEAD